MRVQISISEELGYDEEGCSISHHLFGIVLEAATPQEALSKVSAMLKGHFLGYEKSEEVEGLKKLMGREVR